MPFILTMRFSPDSRHGYVINELGNTVSAFAYDKGRGFLFERDSVPTLPADFDGKLDFSCELEMPAPVCGVLE